MITFSRRNGYNTIGIELKYASVTLKRRIIATFYKQEFDIFDGSNSDNYTTGIEDMMIQMGITYEFPMDEACKQKNAKALEKFILNSPMWYTIFDFIERYLAISDETTARKMAEEFNHILEDEVSAYRIIDKLVIPVTNESELATIEEAMGQPYNSVHIHITKALSLYADRKNPDYENSIKESISAIEAMLLYYHRTDRRTGDAWSCN